MNEGLITAFSSEFKLSVKLESQAMKIRRTVMSPPDNWKSETMALFRSLIRPRCGHDESSADDCGLQLNLCFQTLVATCHIHKLKKFQRNSAMKKWHADPYTCSWAQSKPWVRPTSQVARRQWNLGRHSKRRWPAAQTATPDTHCLKITCRWWSMNLPILTITWPARLDFSLD